MKTNDDLYRSEPEEPAPRVPEGTIVGPSTGDSFPLKQNKPDPRIDSLPPQE
jgi:hypothetical protein